MYVFMVTLPGTASKEPLHAERAEITTAGALALFVGTECVQAFGPAAWRRMERTVAVETPARSVTPVQPLRRPA
jgi:hypothetical protein